MTGYSTGGASRLHSALAYLAFAVTAAWAIAGLLSVFALQHSALFAVTASGYIAVRHVYSNYARRVPRDPLHAVRRNETKAGLS